MERKRLSQLLTWANAAREGKPVAGVSKAALQRLRDYVESWKKCAPNGMLWCNRFPPYWHAVRRALAHTHLIIYPAVDGFIPAWDAPPRVLQSDVWQVDKLFADYVAFFRDKVATCQREGCGRYFERTARKTKYCSDRCGKMATSVVAKSAKRHNRRHAKLLGVLEILRAIRNPHRDRSPRSKDSYAAIEPDADLTDEESVWKDAVIKNVKGVTVRWLHEAVLERLRAPGNFTNCERCQEIRVQIHQVLNGNQKGGK